MEIGLGISWFVNQEPTAENVRDMKKKYPEDYEDTEPLDLNKQVAAFTIRMPHDVVDMARIPREFPGGTLTSLLWFIYHFYQEVLTFDELEQMHANETDIKYRDVYFPLLERARRGECVKRVELDFKGGNSLAFQTVYDGDLVLNF